MAGNTVDMSGTGYLVPTLLVGSVFWLISALAGAYVDTKPKGATTLPADDEPARTPRAIASLIAHGANILAAGALAVGTALQFQASWAWVWAVLIVGVATAFATFVVHLTRTLISRLWLGVAAIGLVILAGGAELLITWLAGHFHLLP